MAFFLAGASVIDVTLSTCVGAAFVCFAHYYQSPNRKVAVLLGFILGLGFLAKGPVALAIFTFGVLPFLLLRRELKILLAYHWGSLLLTFLIVAAPWCILSEIHNPGFSKYFFWNENIARYLVKDYGDKYGDGHVFPRGTSWLMLVAVFMPWTIALFFMLYKKVTRSQIRSELKSDPMLLYCLCWGLAPAAFFMLGRQLHSSYLLPGIGGLSLFMVRWISLQWDNNGLRKTLRYLEYACLSLSIVVIVASIFFRFAWIPFCISIFVLLPLLISTFLDAKKLKLFSESLCSLCLQLAIFYSISILVFTPHIDVQNPQE